jgi:large subunit ribosomal protein L13
MSMKTFSAKPADVERQWHVVDADGMTLGRLAVEVSILLRGKHKPTFTPSQDCGDFVIVINSDKIAVSGKKPLQKLYRHHTGYIGHLKTFTFEQMMAKDSRKVVEKAVYGMLPHTRLGRAQQRHLHVYTGPEHPHSAQRPEPYALLPSAKHA